VRIVLLTTDTPHHLYYAWRLQETGRLEAILVETRQVLFPFHTAHPFEEERDRYESTHLLSRAPASLEELARVFRTPTVNDPDAVSELRRLRPDVAIVFGTCRLSPEAASIPTTACLNLHGGNPEAYRGLDSHLWAVYHRDFANLVTTLHFVVPELDTGEIVFSTKLPILRGAQLYQLRSINTRACVDLSLLAVAGLAGGLPLPCRGQQVRGRYYSAMPAVLKDDCVAKFARYTASL
jgi:hypothetical protein